jgi:hypothetical protein
MAVKSALTGEESIPVGLSSPLSDLKTLIAELAKSDGSAAENLLATLDSLFSLQPEGLQEHLEAFVPHLPKIMFQTDCHGLSSQVACKMVTYFSDTRKVQATS